jgi:hypothetical protein
MVPRGMPLSNAERQARFRARHKDQQPAAIVRTRRRVDRRSRPQRWRDAVTELLCCKGDVVPLRERQHIAALCPIQLHSRSGFLVRADHLVSSALGERRQIALLACAGLVNSRDPAVESGALSQLDSPRLATSNPLFLLAPKP